MKRVFISMFVALLATVTVQAQQIAVVSGSTTKMCQTLPDAIEAATNGSVIYLPGGGFQIDCSKTKITKQVTIIGIGHQAQSENTDGNTVISGDLYFNEGSSGSAVMGCYISGNVVIGDGNASVNNVLVRYCNLNSVEVCNTTCTGTVINQNYLRNPSNCHYASVEFTNNITHRIGYVKGGTIRNNIINSANNNSIFYVSASTISNNVLKISASECSDNTVSGNICPSTWGDDCIVASFDKLFIKNAGITPASDFHFTDDFKKYSNVGIYGGTGFKEGGMAPVPYVVLKDIPEQTDESGKLNIRIRVKASE